MKDCLLGELNKMQGGHHYSLFIKTHMHITAGDSNTVIIGIVNNQNRVTVQIQTAVHLLCPIS